jgi:hypothetical protein
MMMPEAERQWDAYLTSRDDWERDAQRCLDGGDDQPDCAACGGPLPSEAGGLAGAVCDSCAEADARDQASHQAARDRDRAPDRWPTGRPVTTPAGEARAALTPAGATALAAASTQRYLADPTVAAAVAMEDAHCLAHRLADLDEWGS